MTCDEARQLITTRDVVQGLTRGERAALMNHLNNCQSCDDWLEAAACMRIPTNQQAEIEATIHRDMMDPEYRKTTGVVFPHETDL